MRPPIFSSTDVIFANSFRKGDGVMLDNRLSACAMLVSGKGIAVDVGTDHGYLPCYLVSEGVCEKAIAADINEAPLKSAISNIEKMGLGDKVSAVLSDGLESVSDENVTDVIIAGMGGELIAKIISNAKRFYGADFILQPMTKPELLRRWLFDNGFEIIAEKACKDEFYYTVIKAYYTGRNTPYTDLSLYIGKMKNRTGDEIGWLNKQAQKLRKKGDGLEKSDSRSSEAQYYLQLAEAINRYAQGENV